jgi:hypothetical protein
MNNNVLLDIKYDTLYLTYSKLSSEQKQLGFKNPHCLEYFITRDNIHDCTECMNYLIKSKKFQFNSLLEKDIKIAYKNKKYNMKQKFDSICNQKLHQVYLYPTLINNDNYEHNTKYNKNELDKFKKMNDFKKQDLIYKYDDIEYLLDYEKTKPKPTTVVHWGQIKMFLTTFLFLIKVVKESDKIVHIVYPGSARGDNILILCDMFPNTRWYLVDPNKFHPKLYSHPQIIECHNEFFTNELATYYHDKLHKLKEKVLLISDIRLNTDDASIINDQNMNIEWHKIIQPDYSFLKFRCPYETPTKYDYYKGKIYLQPFAPTSSTETRILLTTELEKITYEIDTYHGKMLYFNRVLRPSHYNALIVDHPYLDHCWDCVYSTYLIKNYIINFPTFNPYKNVEVKEFMNNIINIIGKTNINRIKEKTYLVKNRIMS